MSLQTSPGSADPPLPRLTSQTLFFVLGVVTLFMLTGCWGAGPLLVGILVMLDAQRAGIQRNRRLIGLFDLAPWQWGVGVTGLFVVMFPAYLVLRGRLRTRPGSGVLLFSVIASGGLFILLATSLSLIALGVLPAIPSWR